MPTYEYKCQKCEHCFEQYQSFKDEPLVVCPECKKKALVRVFGTPMFMIKGEPTTIGQIAERNSKCMSEDQKAELNEKNRTKPEKVLPLPSRMSRMSNTPKDEKPWYNYNRTATSSEINSMTPTQKKRYVMEGKK